MKRLFAAFLVMTMLFSFSACGGSTQQETTVTPAPVGQPSPSPTPYPETTPEPEEVPAVSISIETINGVRTVDQFDVGTFSYEYPKIIVNGEDSEAYDTLRSWADEMQQTAESTAQNLMEEAENTYREFPLNFSSPFFYTRTLEKPVVTDSITVVIENTSMYLGGAHPSHISYAWVIDTEDGKLLTLADLGVEDEIISAAAEDVVRQIKENGLKDQLFPDFEDAVKDSILDGSWYLTKDGFALIFPEYSIAPYSAGSFEFTVGYGVLDGIISYDYVMASNEKT